MKLNIDFIYPVGSLYMTTSSVSPETLFGGKWTQITSDAYLKIVTTSAGSLGGTSSSHKIPITSMPSHSHDIGYRHPFTAGGFMAWLPSTDSTTATGYTHDPVSYTGGGQPYYPYYYGVYLWKRTA